MQTERSAKITKDCETSSYLTRKRSSLKNGKREKKEKEKEKEKERANLGQPALQRPLQLYFAFSWQLLARSLNS